ncbi:hypothetical protein C8F01DRAFT_561864 [Mycena amicta]|nr:hypothetical protein C8F01DRAFT_561864 [Mycena amicta]
MADFSALRPRAPSLRRNDDAIPTEGSSDRRSASTRSPKTHHTTAVAHPLVVPRLIIQYPNLRRDDDAIPTEGSSDSRSASTRGPRTHHTVSKRSNSGSVFSQDSALTSTRSVNPVPYVFQRKISCATMKFRHRRPILLEKSGHMPPMADFSSLRCSILNKSVAGFLWLKSLTRLHRVSSKHPHMWTVHGPGIGGAWGSTSHVTA